MLCRRNLCRHEVQDLMTANEATKNNLQGNNHNEKQVCWMFKSTDGEEEEHCSSKKHS